MTYVEDDTSLALSEEFATILRLRKITSVFQPVVNLLTGEIVGFEAFCRGPEGSHFASPVDLLKQAQRDGAEAELNWVCIGSAVGAFLAARVPKSASLFINVTAGLRIDQCPHDIYPVIARAQSSLRVILEFNDAALALDPNGVLATVDRVRRLGWGVSVDDVITSPGCLSVLPLIGADVVKLDMRRLRRDSQGDVAASLGPLLRYVEQENVTFVVTGVESAADARIARALGATIGQGFEFGPPSREIATMSLPHSVIPLVGLTKHAMPRTSPWEIVKGGQSHVVSSEELMEIGSYFVKQAIASKSRPVALIRQAKGVLLESVFDLASLKQLSDRAVLRAVFGPQNVREVIPDWRRVVVTGSDPMRNQTFLVLLTESFVVGIVAKRLIDQEGQFDVVVTQDPHTVYQLADHLIRRMPSTDGEEISKFDQATH